MSFKENMQKQKTQQLLFSFGWQEIVVITTILVSLKADSHIEWCWFATIAPMIGYWLFGKLIQMLVWVSIPNIKK